MGISQEDLGTLKNLVGDGNIYDVTSPEFENGTMTWAVNEALNPTLLVRPPTLDILRQVYKYVYDSDLDFTVRNGGVGSASSQDVVISLDHFNSFDFDDATGIATVGCGQLWGDVDRHMKEKAPGWAVLTPRSPFLGVAGVLITGGISWLSHEFGLASDPKNLLDVQMVLPDGRCIWASEEPELLWAQRGGRGCCGALVNVKLQAKRYRTSGIYAGSITIPTTSIDAFSNGLSAWTQRCTDPKVACHVNFLHPKSRAFAADEPTISLFVYDQHGVEHGRSDAGFKWMLDIPGAVEKCTESTLYDINDMTSRARFAAGKSHLHHCGALVPTIDPLFVKRAYTWYEKTLNTSPALASASFVIIEVQHSGTFNSAGSTDATAFPHAFRRHLLQLGVGFSPRAVPEDELLKFDALSFSLMQDALNEIPESQMEPGDFAPLFLEKNMDIPKMYGVNWGQLKRTGRKYDPKNKIRSGVFKPWRGDEQLENDFESVQISDKMRAFGLKGSEGKVNGRMDGQTNGMTNGTTNGVSVH